MYNELPKLRRYDELSGKTFVVCVGAMKCATSWLYGYLETLEGVTVSPLKEVHFFNTRFSANALGDMDGLAIRRLGVHVEQEGDPVKNLRFRPSFRASVDRVQMIYDDDAYFGHFARICGPETRTLCDVTPAYAAIGPAGFEYLRDFFASQDVTLKILYVMRDPVDRLWSQLRHLTENSRDADYVTEWAQAFEAPAICARADYQGTVSDIDATFSADDVLYLFYETLFQTAKLKRLCALAGAAYAPADTATIRNETALKAKMPKEALAAARHLLAPQYAFCRARFGDELPDNWLA